MLLLVVVAIIAVATYAIITNDNTPEERDAMLKDKEMWP